MVSCMNSFFDQCERMLCLNLDSRPERWVAAQEEFKKLGLEGKVTRFPALIGSGGEPYYNGRRGLCMSYTAMIEQAKADKLENILIFQDDLLVIDDVPKLAMPANYDIFYIGVRTCWAIVEAAGDFIRLLGNCYELPATVYNHRVYDRLLEHISKPDALTVDLPIAEKIMPQRNCYSFNPPVVLQSDSESNLRPCYTTNRPMQLINEYNGLAKITPGLKPITYRPANTKVQHLGTGKKIKIQGPNGTIEAW